MFLKRAIAANMNVNFAYLNCFKRNRIRFRLRLSVGFISYLIWPQRNLICVRLIQFKSSNSCRFGKDVHKRAYTI